MSHFCCVVITPNKPSEKELRAILQPWHEYECTDVKDQYVVEVDITDEVLEDFNKPVEVVVLNPGNENLMVFSRYDDIFYTKKPESEFRGREFELPEGAEIRTIPAEEARKFGLGYQTMAECANENYGETIEHNGKFYRLTNPNAKWDWWSVGGRWTGLLTVGYEPEKDPRNIEVCSLCQGKGYRTDAHALENLPDTTKEGGCNGCGGKGTRTKWPTEWEPISGDQAMLENIPIDTLRDRAERDALDRYDRAHEIIAGRNIPNWDEISDRHSPNMDAARDEYHNNQVRKDLLDAKIIDHFSDLDMFELTREQTAAQARANAFCPFAFVHEGKWYERGEMGWWGTVTEEKDKKSWAEEFNKLVDSLPKTHWLTVVDCHI